MARVMGQPAARAFQWALSIAVFAPACDESQPSADTVYLSDARINASDAATGDAQTGDTAGATSNGTNDAGGGTPDTANLISTCPALTDCFIRCATNQAVDQAGCPMCACAPLCESHSDCVMAADYRACCGSCEPRHLSTIAGCIAQTLTDAQGCPLPTCGDLGCASPESDCRSQSAFCLYDGRCVTGRCPDGTADVAGVCRPEW